MARGRTPALKSGLHTGSDHRFHVARAGIGKDKVTRQVTDRWGLASPRQDTLRSGGHLREIGAREMQWRREVTAPRFFRAGGFSVRRRLDDEGGLRVAGHSCADAGRQEAVAAATSGRRIPAPYILTIGYANDDAGRHCVRMVACAGRALHRIRHPVFPARALHCGKA